MNPIKIIQMVIKQRLKKSLPEWIIYNNDYTYKTMEINGDAIGGWHGCFMNFHGDCVETHWFDDMKAINHVKSFYYNDKKFIDQFMAEIKRWARYYWKVAELYIGGYEKP